MSYITNPLLNRTEQIETTKLPSANTVYFTKNALMPQLNSGKLALHFISFISKSLIILLTLLYSFVCY